MCRGVSFRCEGNFMYFIRSGRVRLEAESPSRLAWRAWLMRSEFGARGIALQVLGRKEHEIVEAGTTLGDMAVLDQARLPQCMAMQLSLNGSQELLAGAALRGVGLCGDSCLGQSAEQEARALLFTLRS